MRLIEHNSRLITHTIILENDILDIKYTTNVAKGICNDSIWKKTVVAQKVIEVRKKTKNFIDVSFFFFITDATYFL